MHVGRRRDLTEHHDGLVMRVDLRRCIPEPQVLDCRTTRICPGAASSGLFVDGNMCDGEDIAVRLAGVVVPAGATVSFGTRVEEAVAFGMPRHLRLHSRVTVEVTTVIDGSRGVTSIQGKVVHRPPGLTLPTP